MNETVVEIASTALSVFGTFFAVVLAAKYGMAQFYREKQWERKAVAYAAILDALHHIKRYYDFEEHSLGSEYGGSETSKKRRLEFIEKRRETLGASEGEAYAELQRRRDIGALDVSAEAIAALDALETGFAAGRNTTDWSVHIMETGGAVATCLTRMKEIAQKDLQPPSVWSTCSTHRRQ